MVQFFFLKVPLREPRNGYLLCVYNSFISTTHFKNAHTLEAQEVQTRFRARVNSSSCARYTHTYIHFYMHICTYIRHTFWRRSIRVLARDVHTHTYTHTYMYIYYAHTFWRRSSTRSRDELVRANSGLELATSNALLLLRAAASLSVCIYVYICIKT